MQTTRLMRTGCLGMVVALTIATMSGSIGAAGAEDAPATWHYRGELAMSSWAMGDVLDTQIAITGNRGLQQSGPGRPVAYEGVTVELTQNYCDVGTGERVFVGLFGTTATPLEFNRRLLMARWGEVEVTLSGVELRWNGCDDETDWDSETNSTAPPVTVRTAGTLTSTSELVRSHGAEMVLYDSLRFVTIWGGTGRYAEAAVTLTTGDPYLASLLPLGDAISASIQRGARVEVRPRG